MTGSIAGIERFDSPGKGRGLRVTKPFKTGELLFSTPAHSYVLSVKERGCYCELCFTRKEGLARCGKCKKAFYCNAKCQKGDWAMHKLECSALTAFGENWCPSEISRLVARILAKKKTQKERCASEKMLLIEEIQSHEEDVDNEKREMNVSCNGFTIEDDELSHMGTAVYPDVALINHSCLPSVIVTYNGTSAEIRAVKNMQPGDEVLISYIDLLYPTDDRNNRLRESYYFTCDCQECKTKSKDKAKLKARKRSDPIEPEVISSMSLDEMGAVFDDANVYMLHMMYQAMGVCLYMEDPEGAIRYGEKILKHYCKLYPPYSLNVSSMYLKLGRLYMGMERYSVGVTALKKAMAIMEVAHGKNHSYLTELRKEITKK
ncbi:hypothetical protein F7725_019579 [Dissostichus mawsoni]|uniref:[histone H3]-lysine(4) N-trimethyltransferase n=1 Tax=Dissostichus mawsoni TaxID=36200 RepID=A0A7J5YKG2_DISMA|nr:hypothetical protein F7725_019579 [Dissostichus mawsoni]